MISKIYVSHSQFISLVKKPDNKHPFFTSKKIDKFKKKTKHKPTLNTPKLNTNFNLKIKLIQHCQNQTCKKKGKLQNELTDHIHWYCLVGEGLD